MGQPWTTENLEAHAAEVQRIEAATEANAMLAYAPFPGFWSVIALGPGVEELGPFGTREEARAAALGRGYVLA